MSSDRVFAEDHEVTRAQSRDLRRRSLRLLRVLLAPLRGRIIVAMLLILASTALQTTGPALIAAGIDIGGPALLGQNVLPLALIVLGYFGAGIAGAVLLWHYTMLSARISQNLLFDLRERLYRKSGELSLAFHQSYTAGRIIARQTNDLDAIRELLDSGVQGLIRGTLSMGFISAALIALDPLAGVVILAAIPVIFPLVRWFQLASQRAFRQTRTHSARLIVRFVETMTGIRAVKAFRAEKRNESEFARHSENYRVSSARAFGVFGIFDPALTTIGNIVVAAVLLIGGLRVVEGQLFVGVLLATLLYTRRFFDPVSEMAQFSSAYQSAAAALEKISGVLAQEADVPESKNPVSLANTRGVIDFTGVRFAYLDNRVILPGIDLHIPAGETVAVVGRTGAGKSTLAKLAARFYDPSEGTVSLDGISLQDIAAEDLRKKVLLVTQEGYLFSGSVAENIALAKPDASLAEIVHVCRLVGADKFVSALPDGYQTEMGARGNKFSAGQRQLLSFARAMLADPAVLILDEATSMLDATSQARVQQGLAVLLANRTAIIIAHRPSTIRNADRVLVMESGLIIEDGAPEAISSVKLSS